MVMPALLLKPARKVKFRERLLAWYICNRRDLPWRRTRDPYAIWLSEIMLQQTRVAAVLGYYSTFLSKFPSVAALASAEEDAVLAAWSGLGYYRRARFLHQTAKVVVGQSSGKFPTSSAELAQLPGIGRYTAAAIGSIAFNEPVAVVDGNVERVLGRLFALPRLSDKEAWASAQDLLDPTRPGDFNQAVMELGATICLPAQPLCAACPVRPHCATRGAGERATQPARKKRHVYFYWAKKAGRIYLVRRSADARLMPAMWELPNAPGHSGVELLRLRHAITITDYDVHILKWSGRSAKGGRWVSRVELPHLPLTGLTRKVVRRLLGPIHLKD